MKKAKTTKKDLIATLKKVQADFENFKKQTEKHNINFRKYAESNLVKQILPILETLDNALKHKKDEGLEQIREHLKKSLGVKEIECLNKTFDPHIHEVLMTVEGEEDDKITEEIQKGYKFHEKVIRHPKVKITKKKVMKK